MMTARQNSPTRRLLSGIALFSFALLTAAPMLAQYDDPPARVARLGHLEGQVSIQPSGVDQWSQASSNYPVATGDRVYADQDGRSEISAGSVVARVWHSTDVTMTNLTDQLVQLGLAQGTLRVHTYTVNSNNQVEIDTPNGAVTVTRPGDIRVDAYSGDDGTIVTVNSGAVQLSGPDLQQDVYAGQSVRLQGSNPIEVSDNQMPGMDEFDSWSLDRDRHTRNSQTARYVNRDAVGSEDLDDYGSWSQTNDYGPVWYPRQVSADWAPYREGHWVWTGPWGWTWVEDEPWGYAPFHYGRWVHVEDRWGWMPGPVDVRPVWSPALVAFVGGGGGGFSIGFGGVSAWFPLGPGEPYHPWYHCSDNYAQRVNVTNVNITNIHNTTIINNYNTYLQNPQDSSRLNNTRYANREVAVTAMRQADFASARSARTNMVHVDPVQLQRAQIVAHPLVKPTTVSVAPRPVSVPVPVQRPTLLTQGGRQMQATPGARSQAVPYKPAPSTVNGGRANGQQRAGSPAMQGPTGAGSRTVVPQNPGSQNRGNSGLVAPNVAPNTGSPSAGSQGNYANRPLVTRNGTVSSPSHPLPQTNAPGNAPGTVNSGRPQQPYTRPEYTPGAPRTQTQSPQTQGLPPQRPQQGSEGQQAYPPQQPRNTIQQQPQQAQPYPQQQRPLVNRNETPGPRPNFQQQQPALNQHPGRPLEPQQLQNLNQGRPAGPSRDAEYPPHAQAQPRQPSPQNQTPQNPRSYPPQDSRSYQAPPRQAAPAPQPQYRAPQPQAPVREPQVREPQPQYRAPQPQYREPQVERPAPPPRSAPPARQAPEPKPAPKDKDKQPG